MGYMRHNSILVNGYKDDIEVAHKKAKEIFNITEPPFQTQWNIVSDIICSPVNSCMTFYIAPDGSKEGWSSSDLGDKLRGDFCDWLDSEDKYKYVDVQWADDEGLSDVVRSDYQ